VAQASVPALHKIIFAAVVDDGAAKALAIDLFSSAAG
jgi:hypothetical protein